ncbi:MAG: peptidoglycan-binding protein, partial [Frisingicoccus sp.]|nr:peptidoglycan-binding protein [Frisingicoccus sp.]
MPDMNSFIDKGQLQISAVSAEGNVPINDATIEISPTGEPENVIEQLTTDSSGNSETIDLDAPPVEYSLSPGDNQPYSEYNLKITAPGYDEVLISGIQILSGQLGLSNIRMTPTVRETAPYNPLVIGAHTLWKLYPPKIAEPEIKDIAETGEIVLSRVVVPETIIVHAGPPTDASAPNYYVPYRDYIKNVASSEIYATWPESTIIANVLAIMSFTLNRVYTEWYRNKGFDFTITSSTAYDHFFVYGRNIYESISRVVDT